MILGCSIVAYKGTFCALNKIKKEGVSEEAHWSFLGQGSLEATSGTASVPRQNYDQPPNQVHRPDIQLGFLHVKLALCSVD
jgi:hypothetical protein